LPQHLYIRFIRLPLLLRILLITSMLICLFGLFIHLLEPQNFPTVFDGVWWAIITASTVGYGDYVPLTTAGRLTGIVLLFIGAGFLSTYFITLATAAVTKQEEYIKGASQYKGDGHLVVIGWNERSREIIGSFSNSKQHVILIDETLNSNPIPFHHVHFIKGKALHDEVLLQANIKAAAKVIITADQNLDELQADMNSILTLLAVKGLHPDVGCIVEILTNEQLNNAKRAGADEVIKTNTLTSAIILDSIHSTGMVNPLSDLLMELTSQKLEYQPAGHETIGKSFNQAHLSLLPKGTLLLGIKKGDDLYVNPQNGVTIEKADQLLVITNK
jgi:voltage-gated potassium channel